MNFQILGMDQRNKTVILHLQGISPLEQVSNVQKLQEKMKSQMGDMKEDEQKMVQKFMEPFLLMFAHALEMDSSQSTVTPFLQTSLIIDEEQFVKLDLRLGDFISFKVAKVDKSKLSKQKSELSSKTNTNI